MKQVDIFIKGIVQGVGFRPFVYRLANDLSLFGSVLNDHRGVSITLQGDADAIDEFIHQLEQTPPPLARIDSVVIAPREIEQTLTSFGIIKSEESDDAASVALSPDKSCCQDCLEELNDPSNRHYLYPFINCTNCGPRYSIIKQLPYDRPKTSMAAFAMCPACHQAYTNPLDRRYHAQPVSCPQCGPQLSLYHITHDDGLVAGSNIEKSAEAQAHQVIQQTASLLEQGKIIAIKGLGGFHIICDATNHDAVNLLRQRKRRPAKPLAVMVKDMAQAKLLVEGTDTEWAVLCSNENPITVMQKRYGENALALLSAAVAPEIDRLGLFLPYTPLHHMLLACFEKPIVATSANRSGEPIICERDEIIAKLGTVVDVIVDHNRPIVNACDDSVVQVVHGQLQVIRLARGYAPLTLPFSDGLAKGTGVLAVGGQQKNTIALACNQNLIVSAHIGDLFSLQAQTYFERTLATFKRLYDFKPTQIVRDYHSGYSPSRWADDYCEQSAPPIQPHQVQHHYAHILATMAANQYKDTVLGFSFDGTGLGEDGMLWGSEVMLADPQGYKVIAHFSAFKLIGGEQAIKQPVRILLALLFEHYSLEQIRRLPIDAIKKLSDLQLSNLYTLWKKPNQGLMCRSVGRLFDALAVALNLIESNQFEGQAGMLVEACAATAVITEPTANPLSLSYCQTSQPLVWNSQQLFVQLIDEMLLEPTSLQFTAQMCQYFITALSQAIHGVAEQYCQYPLVFTGGVFQNKCLLSQCLQQAQHSGHKVLASQHVPINDAGLALGQLWYAIHQSSY